MSYMSTFSALSNGTDATYVQNLTEFTWIYIHHIGVSTQLDHHIQHWTETLNDSAIFLFSRNLHLIYICVLLDDL